MTQPQLNDDQLLYVQMIYDYFYEHGEWPTYQYIDRKLTSMRRDLDMEEISKSLPAGYGGLFAFNHNLKAQAYLTIPAIYLCVGSQEDLADFMKAMIYCVEKYFNAKEDHLDEIAVTSEELSDALGFSELAVRKVGCLFRDSSEYSIYASFGSQESDGKTLWTMTLGRRIRQFNGITTIEDYLTKVDALMRPAPTLTLPQAPATAESLRAPVRGTQNAVSGVASKEGELFQSLVQELLKALGFTDIVKFGQPDYQYDFQAIYPTISPAGVSLPQTWVAEAKYRKASNQTLIDALDQLAALIKTMKVDKAVLVTNTNLSSPAKQFLSQLDADTKSKLEVWDANQLLGWMEQFPELGQKYARIKLEMPASSSQPLPPRQQSLIEQLKNCQPGQDDCHKYEDICIAILTEVFSPPLKKPQIQARTMNGLERRDALFPIRGILYGWEQIRQEFAANFLLCEFKNYVEPFGKDEVNQTRNYLRETIGRIGIIFSRKGAAESARQMRNSVYSQEHKVILFLEDEHLIELLNMKEAKQNPLDLIQEAIDKFYISHE